MLGGVLEPTLEECDEGVTVEREFEWAAPGAFEVVLATKKAVDPDPEDEPDEEPLDEDDEEFEDDELDDDLDDDDSREIDDDLIDLDDEWDEKDSDDDERHDSPRKFFE